MFGSLGTFSLGALGSSGGALLKSIIATVSGTTITVTQAAETAPPSLSVSGTTVTVT